MAELVFLYIGISTWANLLMAAGTFFMVYLTWSTIKQIRKQTVFFQKQTLLSVSASNPILEVNNFRIEGNSLHFSIKNIGKGNAYRIGVNAKFFCVKHELESVDAKKGQVYVKFSYDPRTLVDIKDNKPYEVVDNGYVNFISSKKNRVVILKPEESIEIDLIPDFYLMYPHKIGDTVSRKLDFTELMKFLKGNKCRFVGFSFELLYKNIIENVMDSGELSEFIYDMEIHKTLEDAFRQGYKLTFFALSQDKMELMMGGIGYKEYRGLKSERNFIEGEMEKDAVNYD